MTRPSLYFLYYSPECFADLDQQQRFKQSAAVECMPFCVKIYSVVKTLAE